MVGDVSQLSKTEHRELHFTTAFIISLCDAIKAHSPPLRGALFYEHICMCVDFREFTVLVQSSLFIYMS